jgi:hypothetical protein
VTRGRGYLLRVDREHLDAALFQDRFTAGRAALQAGRDAEAAQTLRGALDLWRGPVLADLADYAFIQREAVRLEELRLAALEARIEADLALGRHDELTAELEQLTADHPLRERLHGQLMLALYWCGRLADALAAYRRVRDLLADELGSTPGSRCSGCTHPSSPTTRRWTGTVAATHRVEPTQSKWQRPRPPRLKPAQPKPPRSNPTRSKPPRSAPRFLPRRRGHLAGRHLASRPRAVGCSLGRTTTPAAWWPSAWRLRSRRPCALSPWPSRGPGSQLVCRATVSA